MCVRNLCWFGKLLFHIWNLCKHHSNINAIIKEFWPNENMEEKHEKRKKWKRKRKRIIIIKRTHPAFTTIRRDNIRCVVALSFCSTRFFHKMPISQLTKIITICTAQTMWCEYLIAYSSDDEEKTKELCTIQIDFRLK